MMGDMQLLSIILNLLLRAILLGPVLWAGWNYGVVNFFPEAPLVDWLSAMIFLGALQTLLVFLIRPVHRELLPVYIPTDGQVSRNPEP